jgi:hypothetical protein
VKYRLIDIRGFDAEDLMDTGNAGDLVLALLARGGVAKMREIVRRAMRLREPARRRALTQLAVLSGLRGASEELKMEFKRMSIMIEDNVFLREAWEDGEAKGRAKGKAEGKAEGMAQILSSQLALRFGPLPAWANTRLSKATSAQLSRWSAKVLTAPSLEGVIGRK